MSDMVKTKDK